MQRQWYIWRRDRGWFSWGRGHRKDFPEEMIPDQGLRTSRYPIGRRDERCTPGPGALQTTHRGYWRLRASVCPPSSTQPLRLEHLKRNQSHSHITVFYLLPRILLFFAMFLVHFLFLHLIDCILATWPY